MELSVLSNSKSSRTLSAIFTPALLWLKKLSTSLSYNFEYLLTVNTTVAFCNEKIDIYLARDLVKSEQNLDEDEEINVELWDVQDLKQMIYEGKITDGKTVAAIMTYAAKYQI